MYAEWRMGNPSATTYDPATGRGGGRRAYPIVAVDRHSTRTESAALDSRADRLSDREREVLQLAADGYDGPAIAQHLLVGPATVKTHFLDVYEKLGVDDRSAAVARALRQGRIA
jgi:ATP/maltotriose-dependent transcriptional regulator MalT